MQAWVIGNWKQNPATHHDAMTLVDTLLDAPNRHAKCQLMVAPSCIHLATVNARLQGSGILCAAQDISAHSHSTGAYTGDCSAQQIVDAGASWTLLGHSERRQYHQECHDILVKKLGNAMAQGLGVILCVGETQAQYDDKQTLTVLNEQLTIIKTLMAQQADNAAFVQTLTDRLIIAYEPVWAIGTGKVPTVNEVSATHQYIKQTVASFVPTLDDISVLYGGSVNADNADTFAASPMINGALVGGAALKADSFLAIAAAFDNATS